MVAQFSATHKLQQNGILSNSMLSRVRWASLLAHKSVLSCAQRCVVASKQQWLRSRLHVYTIPARDLQSSPLEAEKALLSHAAKLSDTQLQAHVRACLQYGLVGEISASPSVVTAVSAYPPLLHDLCKACVANDLIDEAATLLLLSPKPADEFVSEVVNYAATNRLWDRKVLDSDVAVLPAMAKMLKQFPNHITARKALRKLARIAVEADDLELVDLILTQVVHENDYRMQMSMQAELVPLLSKSPQPKHAALATRLLAQFTNVQYTKPNARLVEPIMRHDGLAAAILRMVANQVPEKTALQWAQLLLPRMVTRPGFERNADCLLTLAIKLSTGGLTELKQIVSRIRATNEVTAGNLHVAFSTLAGFGHHNPQTEEAQLETAVRTLLTKYNDVIAASIVMHLVVAPGAAKWKYATLWRIAEGDLLPQVARSPRSFATLIQNMSLELPLEHILQKWRELEEASKTSRGVKPARLQSWERFYAALLRQLVVHAPNVPVPAEDDVLTEILRAAASKRLDHSITLTHALSDHFLARNRSPVEFLAFVKQHIPVLDRGSAALLFVNRLFKASAPTATEFQEAVDQLRSLRFEQPEMHLPIAVYVVEVYQQGRISGDDIMAYLRCLRPLISSVREFPNLLDHLSATASTLGDDKLMLATMQELRQYDWIPTQEYVDTIVRHCIMQGNVRSAWAAMELLIEGQHWQQLSVGLFAAVLRAAAQASLWDETERIWRCYSELHNQLSTSITDQLDIRVAYVFYKFCQGELDAANDFTRKLLRNMEGPAAKQFMERLVSTIAPINWDFAAQVFYEMLKQHMVPGREVFDAVMHDARSDERVTRANFLKQQYLQLVAAKKEAPRSVLEESSWEPS